MRRQAGEVFIKAALLKSGIIVFIMTGEGYYANTQE
jgi:hypothetical protein